MPSARVEKCMKLIHGRIHVGGGEPVLELTRKREPQADCSEASVVERAHICVSKIRERSFRRRYCPLCHTHSYSHHRRGIEEGEESCECITIRK